MEGIYIKINELEERVLDHVKVSNDLKRKNKYLEESLLKNEEKLSKLEKLYKELETENKRLKVVNAISGNNEYKKVMKLQMNRLIKEIDACIVGLKNS